MSENNISDILSVDVGSGLSKFKYAGKLNYIPSCVGEVNKDENISLGASDNEVIEYKDKVYVVGHSAMSELKPERITKSATRNWSEKKENIILHLSIIASIFPNGFKGTIPLVTGLPIAKFYEVEKQFKKNFCDTYKFKTKNAHYEVTFKEESTEVLPQALGLYFTMRGLDKSGDWGDRKVCVIDPGTYTTAIAVIKNGRFVKHQSFGVEVGLWHLGQELSKKLESKYGFSFDSIQEMLEAMKKGEFKAFSGKGSKMDKYKIADETRDIVSDVYSPFIKKVRDELSNHKQLEMYISSGGAEYLKEMLKNTYQQIDIIKSNMEPIYHVVNGFDIYGVSKGLDKIKATDYA